MLRDSWSRCFESVGDSTAIAFQRELLMKARFIIVGQCPAIVAGFLLLCASGSAQERATSPEAPRPPVEVPGITSQVLSRTTVAGAPGKLSIAARVTYEPGARRPKHYHTSQVFFYILEGTMAVQEDGKEPIPLKPGDYLLVKPGTVHAHWNASTAEKLVFTEFTLVDEGQRSTVFVEQ
jgi:quercetin dioxygenase-like cupin family protein